MSTPRGCEKCGTPVYSRNGRRRTCVPCQEAAVLDEKLRRGPKPPKEPPPDLSAGVCFGSKEPDTWFPKSTEFATMARAKSMCNRCPVQAECLQYALSSKPRYGIWGGKTITEMKAARRRGAA